MRARRELLLLVVVYVGYTVSRHFAEAVPAPAAHHARFLVRWERAWHLNWEPAANRLFVDQDWIGIASDFWYASTHYIVTPVVLFWLYRQGREKYLPARTGLLIATAMGLVFYLLMPTAPPRLVSGYVDLMALHADVGWWSTAASAPKGMGDLTNQFAAFPSLHAGWALWVALAIHSATRNPYLRTFGYLYAATTTTVVIGTANHWVIDVLVGWLVVGVAWWVGATIRTSVETAIASARASDEPLAEPASN